MQRKYKNIIVLFITVFCLFSTSLIGNCKVFTNNKESYKQNNLPNKKKINIKSEIKGSKIIISDNNKVIKAEITLKESNNKWDWSSFWYAIFGGIFVLFGSFLSHWLIFIDKGSDIKSIIKALHKEVDILWKLYGEEFYNDIIALNIDDYLSYSTYVKRDIFVVFPQVTNKIGQIKPIELMEAFIRVNSHSMQLIELLKDYDESLSNYKKYKNQYKDDLNFLVSICQEPLPIDIKDIHYEQALKFFKENNLIDKTTEKLQLFKNRHNASTKYLNSSNKDFDEMIASLENVIHTTWQTQNRILANLEYLTNMKDYLVKHTQDILKDCIQKIKTDKDLIEKICKKNNII